ncbi:MAG: response regulator [Lacibacter sp.]|nr:response regulator [Lacibacter sp.]
MKNNVTLFIIDDDEDDRKLFIDAAKEVDENIQCTVAGDGQEALKMLKNELNPLPDYIFLDLRMPRINGKQCLEEIRKDERLKHIPVFIYTTSKEVEESIELKKMGAIHFISKPINPEDIYYILSVTLDANWRQN